MNMANGDEFQKEMLEFMRLYHEKLERPSEGLLQRALSPLQFYALCVIREERPSMSEIAQKLKMPKQHVTKIVNKLAEHGVVQRVCDAEDRRITRVEMSPEADAFFERQVMERLGVICRKTEVLGAAKCSEFWALLRRMSELLRQLPDEGTDARKSRDHTPS